jgi:hypothetical protein
MAASLFALLRRLRCVISGKSSTRPAPPAPRPVVRRPVAIQSLEGRRMLNGGRDNLVVSEQLIGPELGITSVVLTFNQPLDAATADNPNAYAIVRKVNETNDDSSSILGSLSPFGSSSSSSSQSILSKHVRIASAVYDPANLTVTLTPTAPFRADKYFRFLRVVGTGKNAIFTAAGQPVDGAGKGKPSDAIIKFASKAGRRLVYDDSYGNKVTINLSGPGEIRALYRRVGTLDPIVFVVGSVPGESVLTGVVKPGHHGTGVTVLQELSGTSAFTNDLALNSDFNVELTEP